MKISVAMCTYNGEKYIRQQLDSIFSQKRLPDEIVVCDDISRDNTVGIVEEYKDRGIELRIFRNQENLGFAENFRSCISKCTGDIIFLCDQDDIWEPDKTRELCGLMEENSSMLSVVTNFYLVDSDGLRLSEGKEGDNPFFDKRKYRLDWKRDRLHKVNVMAVFSNNIGPGCTQAIRRQIVGDLLNCPLRDPHDYILNRAAALKDGLYYYDKPLTRYRVHGNQTLGVPGYVVSRFRKDYATMMEEYLNLPRELIYHVFLPDSGKVALPPKFDDTHRIVYYDTVPMASHVRLQYEKWKRMSENRTALYQQQPGRLKHFLRQGSYNRYFVFGYGLVERLRIRFWDLAMLLGRKR